MPAERQACPATQAANQRGKSSLARTVVFFVLLMHGLFGGCSSEQAAPVSEMPPTSDTPVFAADVAPRASVGANLRITGKIEAARAARFEQGRLRFHDVADAMGVVHQYENGAAGQRLMVEATGGGCGWIDYDRDGRFDLYLTQGGDPAAPRSAAQPADQLFRNLGSRFEAVTISAGTDERGYSQGVAIADFDNDGFDDVYVANVRGNVLYHNAGDGTFQDVTWSAGVAGNLWSSSAAWGDLDGDGNLDLYVCNYVDFDPVHPRICHNSKGLPAMCHPNQLDAVPDECYLNLGDGTFSPVARQRGLYGPGNKALGVVIADFNNDGSPDIYVANDTTPNFLFINQGDAHFVETAVAAGCAVSGDGLPQASMGVALGDYDRNGFLDLFVTNFVNEWDTLYANLGHQGFHDVTGRVGLVKPTLSKLGFGTIMADFDLDGWMELFVANGHIDDHRSEGGEWEMNPQMFTFDGIRFHDVSDDAGDYFLRKWIGRGVATADFDDDGDLDLVVVHQGAPTALLRNDSRRGHWLKLAFIGRVSNRSAIGVRVNLRRQGEETLMQELAGGTSYAASQQPVLVFGLGNNQENCTLEIRWPGGVEQRLEGVAVDQSLVLVEPSRSTTAGAESK